MIQVQEEWEKNEFIILPSDEDIHTAVERRLTVQKEISIEIDIKIIFYFIFIQNLKLLYLGTSSLF